MAFRFDSILYSDAQIAEGDHAGAVKKSPFYYEPAAVPGYYDPAADWKTWTSWSKQDADALEGHRLSVRQRDGVGFAQTARSLCLDAQFRPSETGGVTLTLDPATDTTPRALIRLERTVAGPDYVVRGGAVDRGGTVLPLTAAPRQIQLAPASGGSVPPV